MFTAWILLMLNSLFFTLRLSGGGKRLLPPSAESGGGADVPGADGAG